MKAERHDRKVRLARLVALCALLLEHVPSALAQSPGEDRTDQQGWVVTSHACPSQDFATFLQRYADMADDSVRNRFTDDPLEYEVPTHTVEDEASSSPPTHVSLQHGLLRLELFPYRYLKETQTFGRIDPRVGQEAKQTTAPYPVAISLAAEDGRKVSFGAEYEVDTYAFKRSHGCWYLSRAIDLRD